MGGSSLQPDELRIISKLEKDKQYIVFKFFHFNGFIVYYISFLSLRSIYGFIHLQNERDKF